MTLTVNSTAIHEAGHACVAAYLRVPFTHVTIKPQGQSGGRITMKQTIASVRSYSYNRKTDSFQQRSDDEITKEVNRQIINHALVVLAARAAVDMMNGLKEVSEDSYASDETTVRRLAEMIKIADVDFQAWRYGLLERAREIVRLPGVRFAILRVAAELYQEYSVAKRGISASRVREILQTSKATADYYSGRRPFVGKYMPLMTSPETVMVLSRA